MFQSSPPLTINVYGKAVIKQSSFNQQSETDKTRNSIIFPFQGELCGVIICKTSTSVDFSLFVESMNILLGQLLTNLEIEEDIFCKLEAPIQSNKIVELEDYQICTNLNYKLFTLEDTYDCEVVFLANQSSVKEV